VAGAEHERWVGVQQLHGSGAHGRLTNAHLPDFIDKAKGFGYSGCRQHGMLLGRQQAGLGSARQPFVGQQAGDLRPLFGGGLLVAGGVTALDDLGQRGGVLFEEGLQVGGAGDLLVLTSGCEGVDPSLEVAAGVLFYDIDTWGYSATSRPGFLVC
jgi:hypothetical protein